MYYLDDFMKKSNSIKNEEGNLLHVLYSQLSLMNDHTGLKKYATYENMLAGVASHYLEIYDKISEVIDSPLLIDDIIKQQEYYISEIERLESVIKEKGNITKLPNKLFVLYLEFLKTFKENAYNRINQLLEQKKQKISTIKFN